MTTAFDDAGRRWGATVVEIPKQEVAGKRTQDKNGYTATIVKVQSSKDPKVQRREIRGDYEDEGEVKWDEIIKVGDVVKVTGISKGKGFAGVVKRHGFAGGPRTHGQSDRERARGSSGSTTTPGRVLRGKRMAGRMGNDQVSVKKLQVLGIDVENRRVILRGAVPGSGRTLLTLTTT